MTRKEAIKIIYCYDIGFYDLSGEKIPADKLVEAFDMAIEALSAPQTDLISRADAIEMVDNIKSTDNWQGAVIALLSALPSADAVQGEWKCMGDCGVTECDQCGWSIEEYVGDYNYCPNCGAKMKGGNDV